METRYPTLVLKPGKEKPVQKGHPWIFSGAVARREGIFEPGKTVAVRSADGMPLGVGFYNPGSDIVVRLFSRQIDTPIGPAFWRDRIRRAIRLRAGCVPAGTTAYRLINAEGDFLPGLVVDRYGDILAVAIGTLGMETIRSTVVDCLVEAIGATGVWERSTGRARRREGLEERTGLLRGSVPERIPVEENGCRFVVNVQKGQKTGFFLDQRPNREIVRTLSHGAVVLNGFAYTGGFSVYAAAGGAKRVVSVDSSSDAASLAVENLVLNGFSVDTHPVRTADMFRFLRETADVYDVVVLDPPSLAKSPSEVARAARAYKDANLHAMRRIRDGGLLMTFSCSNFISAELFAKVVQGAAVDAGKTAQVLSVLQPGPDHPTDLAHPEGRYLKGLLLRVGDVSAQ